MITLVEALHGREMNARVAAYSGFGITRAAGDRPGGAEGE
jgi:hypothetical protein